MPKRGSIASCACAPCRKRKTRCDGARPTCRACEQRRAECRYDVEEGITRTAALKGRLEQLELDYGSLVDLHSQLKHGQPDEVAALVNRIRAEDFPEVRSPLEQGSITADGLPDGMDSTEDGASDAKWDSSRTPLSGFGDIQQNPFTPIPFYGSMGDDIPIDPALSGLDPQLQQMGQSGSSSFAQQAMMQGSFNQGPGLQMYGTSIASESTPSARQLFQNHVPGMLRTNLPIVRHGMALRSRSMPESCSAYSDAQIERLIREVEVQADHEIPKSRLCELSSIAAVAAQYVRGAIQPGLIDFFYDAAKHFFEDCMQSPLPHLVPLKVCAMLALANILSRSFLAFVYIDLGLSLAQSLDDQSVPASQTTNRPDFVEARRVRGTLLSLRGYAHKHAGMSFQAGPGLVDGVDPEEEDEDSIPTDSKQMDGWMSRRD